MLGNTEKIFENKRSAENSIKLAIGQIDVLINDSFPDWLSMKIDFLEIHLNWSILMGVSLSNKGLLKHSF